MVELNPMGATLYDWEYSIRTEALQGEHDGVIFFCIFFKCMSLKKNQLYGHIIHMHVIYNLTCTTQWFLVYLHNCATIHQIKF